MFFWYYRYATVSDRGFLEPWFASGPAPLCGIAEVEDHQDLFIFRQAQLLGQLIRIEEVEPAAVHTCVGGGQHQVGRHDGGILHAGVPLSAGISKDAVFIEGHNEADPPGHSPQAA